MPRHVFTAVCVALYAVISQPAAAQEADGPVELRNARAAYQQQIKITTDPIKLRYSQTLELLKKSLGARGDITGALAVQREIDSLGLPQLPPMGGRDDAKLVIWNQNNGGKGDRGTRKINVVLRFADKEVWRKNGLRMNWDRTKQDKEVVAVPSTGVDTIRIELVELVNGQGGLAEVEYLKDGKNVALGCAVTTSGVWQNQRWCAPEKLTDGTPDSFWLLPDRKTGWAEINLKERK